MKLLDAAGEGGDPGASAASTTAAATGVTASAAFDWTTTGIDSGGMALVTERGWKAPGELLNSYRNLEKLKGVPPDQLLQLPKTLDPAAMGDVYDRLGRPKTASEYKLADTETPYTTAISTAMHQAGLNTAQAQALVKAQTEFNTKAATDAKAAYDAQVAADKAAMTTEWGDKHDANLATARRAAQTFGMKPEQINALEQVMGYAGVHKFLHNIGAKLGEAEFVQAGGKASEYGGMSADSARAEIDRLTRDKNFAAQFNSRDPVVQAEARGRMSRLQLAAG